MSIVHNYSHTKKDILYDTLLSCCAHMLNDRLFLMYAGHGWSNAFIVLYTTEKDYLIKYDNNPDYMKIISDDGCYKTTIKITPEEIKNFIEGLKK